MRKILVLATALLLITGFGASMDKGELIDNIVDDADLTKADAKRALDAFMENAERSVERGRANGRKTVRPEDLVAVASGHGDDVRDTALLFEALCEGQTLCDNIVADNATGHGDDVSSKASHRAARKGRNPQTGEERATGGRRTDPGELGSLVTIGDLDGDGDVDLITVWINDGDGSFSDFNISIPDEEAEDIETVGQAIEYLEKNAK